MGVGTYWTEGNSSGCQADQTTVPRMRLVHSVGVLIAELLENIVNALIVFYAHELSNDALKAARWWSTVRKYDRGEGSEYSPKEKRSGA